MVDVSDLLDEWKGLSTDGVDKPKTAEEKELMAKKSEIRKKWLEDKGKELGTSANQLKKQLDKALKKVSGDKKAKGGKNPEKAKKVKKEQVKKEEENEEDKVPLEEKMRKILEEPEKNIGRGGYYVNSKENLERHLKETGGKWQLRFPPEPNGWLHIGHAKAMSVNFGTAKANNGNCYLRFDDTNPEAEKQEYIDGILENCSWLGHEPFKVTYTSDYFQKLYELAVELIKRGKAYVCFLNGNEVKAQRKALEEFHKSFSKEDENGDENTKTELPPDVAKLVYDESRERSPEENLILFEKMRQGRYDEGEATLRMKGDFLSPNPNMWDHMAYRIMFKSHPRTKDAWCIYPTYDYSHCLVDSLENITHSLCTLEFETRQSNNSSYHWLLDALDMYHPKTWESSRCSISYNVMSKRRLRKLVVEKYVDGWDDPRLLTLAGLRRRGYTPDSINNFCRLIGVARTSNEVCVRFGVLESCIRSELDKTAPRRFAILKPVKLIITNLEGEIEFEVPNHPANPEMGSRKITLTKTLYIPGEKFSLEMKPGYKGLVPNSEKNNSARLLYAKVVTYESHVEEGDSFVVNVRLETAEDYVTPKGISVVPWVGENAIRAEARLYDKLFHSCVIDGAEVHAEKAIKELGKDDITDLVNKDSLRKELVLLEPGIKEELGKGMRWQFTTVGYFFEDIVDSTKENPVFNLTVSLKEDKNK